MHRALLWITIVSLVGLGLTTGTVYVIWELRGPSVSAYPGLASPVARQIFSWCNSISSGLRPVACVSLALYLLSSERLRRTASSGFEVVGRSGDGT